MRALITGVGGQDGTIMATRLVSEGWDVHGTVRSERPEDRTSVDGITVHEVDLADLDAVGAAVARLRPDLLVNLGGISSVAESWRSPARTGLVSGVAVSGMLEAVLRLRDGGHATRFVQASSAEIFGEPSRSPQDEGTPLAPVSPYGAAKAYAHEIVGMFRAQGVHASSAILFNHESTLRPLGFVTRKITRGAAQIALGMSDRLSLGNLDARRDWSWAPDIVDGMLAMAAERTPGDYVLASGESHSVVEFAEAAFLAAGVEDWRDRVDVDESLVRPSDATEQRGDISKAEKVLGWKPTVTFDQIVARMVEADIFELSEGVS